MGQHFENGSTFSKWVAILKMGQRYWKWAKILKIGQQFENGLRFKKWAKFWKWVNILKIGQNFENGSAFWILKHVKCVSYHPISGIFQMMRAKNWSRKSARHLQMTRVCEMRVDTRGLNCQFFTKVSITHHKLSTDPLLSWPLATDSLQSYWT